MVKENENSHRHHDCRFPTVDPQKLDKLLDDAPILHDVAGAIRAAPIDFVRIILWGAASAIGLLVIGGVIFFMWRSFVYFSHSPNAPPPLPTKQL